MSSNDFSKATAQGIMLEQFISYKLLRLGYNPLLPVVPACYDIGIETKGGFKRLQIKSSFGTSCDVRRSVGSSKNNRTAPYLRGDFDHLLACFLRHGEKDIEVLVVPYEFLKGTNVNKQTYLYYQDRYDLLGESFDNPLRLDLYEVEKQMPLFNRHLFRN